MADEKTGCAALAERLIQLEQDMEKIRDAFPEGDYQGHARAHQVMIERNQELRRLRIAIAEKTIAGLIWAGMIALGLGIWELVLSKLGIR